MSCQSTSALRAQCKRTILNLQADGEIVDWTSKSNTFLIHKIPWLKEFKERVKIKFQRQLIVIFAKTSHH
jgi:hypothetical protein